MVLNLKHTCCSSDKNISVEFVPDAKEYIKKHFESYTKQGQSTELV